MWDIKITDLYPSKVYAYFGLHFIRMGRVAGYISTEIRHRLTILGEDTE